MFFDPPWHAAGPLAVFCILGAGCASVDAERPVVGRYVGLVEVRAEPSVAGNGPAIGRTRVRALGGWIELSPRGDQLESLGAGWRSSTRLAIPADCRLVVVVRTDAQLASVRALLDSDVVSKGEKCVFKEKD